MNVAETTDAILDVLMDRDYEVTRDTCPCTTFEEIALDSLDKVELVQLVEDITGGELTQARFAELKTIQHLAEALADHE